MSRKLEMGTRAVRAFAEACGIDPDKDPIKSIDIHADCGGVATVTVAFLSVDDRRRAAEIIRRYRLEEVVEHPVVEPGAPVKFREFT